jgi:IPT/TIG domain
MRLHARLHGSRKQIGIFGLTLLMMVVALAPNASAGAGGTPVPFVQAISPVSVAPGGNSFTLTVTGANFVPASSVFWGSSQLATTYVSSTRLTGVRGDD